MLAAEYLRAREYLFSTLSQPSPSVELIVRAAQGRQHQLADSLAKIAQVQYVYDLIPYVACQTTPEIGQELANKIHNREVSAAFRTSHKLLLEQAHGVEISAPVSIVPNGTQPQVYTDLRFSRLWNLDRIGAYKAQKKATGAKINIAIIDTGVDYNHPQFRGRFTTRKGYDFIGRDHYPMDRNGHGTHVAGIACSADYGVSTQSTLYAVRVLDSQGYGTESTVIAGIEWCIKEKMDVANLSLGSGDASTAFEEICRIAYMQGLLLVAAAGNEGKGPSYPASFDEFVLAVASTNKSNEHSDFSNIYPTNDISAPGENIVSCYLNNSYAELDGTSMATPHVTGAAALALSLNNKSLVDLESAIDTSAQPLENQEPYEDTWVFGAGLLRADTLVETIQKIRLRASAHHPLFWTQNH
ncbi:MAG: S8 family peptidase [Candidatus Woesearchaeota archaeon]